MSSPARDAALARARAFLDRHGSDAVRLRAAVLLGGAEPAGIEREVDARQQPDGAVAPLAGGPADLDSTAAALEELGDLRLLDFPCAERAARFVTAAQLADGSFGSAGAEPEERLQQSGRLAPVLARMVCVSLGSLEALGEFLAGHFSVERVQRGGYADLAPFLPFFAIHPHELSDAALQWCGRELERSFRTGRLSALEAGRLFVRSEASSLPAARLDGREIVPALLTSQRPDGSFGESAGGADPRVDDTLDAVLVLLRLG